MKEILALCLIACCYCSMGTRLSKTVESRLKPIRMPKDKKMVDIITSFDRDDRDEVPRNTEAKQQPVFKHVIVHAVQQNKMVANPETITYVDRSMEPVTTQTRYSKVAGVPKVDEIRAAQEATRNSQKVEVVSQTKQINSKPIQFSYALAQDQEKLELYVPPNAQNVMEGQKVTASQQINKVTQLPPQDRQPQVIVRPIQPVLLQPLVAVSQQTVSAAVPQTVPTVPTATPSSAPQRTFLSFVPQKQQPVILQTKAPQLPQLPQPANATSPIQPAIISAEDSQPRRILRRNYEKSPGTNIIDGMGNTVIGSKNYIRGHDNYLNSQAVVTNLA